MRNMEMSLELIWRTSKKKLGEKLNYIKKKKGEKIYGSL